MDAKDLSRSHKLNELINLIEGVSGGGGSGTDIDLLQEDGSLILQEDGTSTITMEG